MSGRVAARRARAVGLLVALIAVAIGVSGCDGPTSTGASRISAGRLIVYSGLPLVGAERASGRAVLRGERMALAAVHGRVGRYTIVLRSLDDATRSSDGWDPGQTTVDATRAGRDARTIGYLGDLNSGASAVSLPILNRAHIPQISPLSTAVGLTRGGPEASPGEPQKYYPAMARTFARVVPSDLVQSAVQIALQRRAGCRRGYVLYDGEVDGRDAANSYEAAADRAHLDLLGFEQFDPTASNYRSVADKLRKLHPDCVLISALIQDHAVAVTDAVAQALPNASLFLTAPLTQAPFVDPRRGGVPLRDDPRLVFTSPTLAPRECPPAGRRFEARFDRRYGSGADTAIWGDAAMSLLLDAIRRGSDDGRRDVTRTRVLHAIFTTRNEPSVLGRYSIDAQGDTTLARYGVYRVVDGKLEFWRALHG